MAERKRIVYLPYPYYGIDYNEFTRNMVDILQENYEVVGKLDPISNIMAISETEAVILNWTEQKLTEHQKAKILTYKQYGAKIIWFFHNKMAHEKKNREKISENMIWLADNCDNIVLLSKSSRQYIPGKKGNKDKARYIPHVLYKNKVNASIKECLKKKYGLTGNEFVYCIFGGIRPYKNIETAIQCFNELADKNCKLIIAGKPISEEYKRELDLLIGNNKNIIFDPRFLVEMELDSIIALSDVILIPYVDSSSMNSGVLIKAFSNSKTVIAPEICMVNDIDFQNNFLYRWEIGNIQMLKEQMLKAYSDGKIELALKGVRAKQYVEDNNNPLIVKNLMNHLIKESNDIKEINEENKIARETLADIYELGYENKQNSERYMRYHYLFKTMCQWINLRNDKYKISDWIRKTGWNNVVIYGMGDMGKTLKKELEIDGVRVLYAIDKNAEEIETDIPVYKLTDDLKEADGIIVTAIAFYDEIKERLHRKFATPIVSLKDILDEMECLKC